MHVDIIKNEWLAGYQILVERIEPTDPRAAWKTSDYQFASEPHTEEDCPFKDSDTLKFMVHYPVK